MKLLLPIQIGPFEVRNRIVSTAHGAFLDFYRPGEDGERYLAYQERRARGGTGLIVIQPVHVHPSSHALGHYVYDRDDLAPKWRRLADALHAHGARTVVQLFHLGAAFTSEGREDLQPLWGFSPIVSAEGEAAHEMTPAEIEEVIAGFAATAALAVECGLDGVELHCAHGYLLQQSLSPWANQRTDEWGEPLRFVGEVLRRVRDAVGGERIVGIRVSADDFVSPARGGLGPERVREICRELVGTGKLDYVNHSEGARAAHYARAIGSYRHPPGEFLPLARGLREAIDAAVPVIGVGRIQSPEVAERALQEEQCDLVAMTRAQIADPDVVRKLAEGRRSRIRPCVGASQGCIDRMVGGLPITCFHNPDVGRERRGEPAPAATPARVLVVGAGPAGLKAAEIAARRGHEVTVCDRRSEAGGRLLAVRELGPASELFDAVAWLTSELAELGVELRLGEEVDAAAVEASGAEVVVLATGARPQGLAPSDGSVPVVSTEEAAAGLDGARDVLLFDSCGNLETSLVAERVAAAGARLTVATPHLHLGPFVGFTHRKELLERMYELDAQIEPSTLFAGIENGLVTTRQVYSRQVQRRPFDAVVAGVFGSADASLSPAVERAGARLLLAGDAVAPRTALHAFREGDNVGRAV